MKKMYDLYESYVGLYVDGSDIDTLRAGVVLHFNFVSEYAKPIDYSFEKGAFDVRKFFKTFVGNGYQSCLGLGDVPETFYRFFVDLDQECIYLSGTASEHTIPFANLDVDSSTTRPIVERSYITEEY